VSAGDGISTGGRGEDERQEERRGGNGTSEGTEQPGHAW